MSKQNECKPLYYEKVVATNCNSVLNFVLLG